MQSLNQNFQTVIHLRYTDNDKVEPLIRAKKKAEKNSALQIKERQNTSLRNYSRMKLMSKQ